MEGKLHMSYATSSGGRLVAIALVTLLMTALLGTTGVPRADAIEQSSVMDFESGLSPGDTPAIVSLGNGMSGADLGTVSITGYNPHVGGNTAMIYDATCGSQSVPVDDPAFDASMCSGEDTDLYVPVAGQVLIVSEDGDPTNPDDDFNLDSSLTLDFTTWGPGTVTVESFGIADVDFGQSGAKATFFDAAGTVLTVIPIPEIGNNATARIEAGITGVASMVVHLRGSGGIDNIAIAADSPIIDLELVKDVDPAEVEVGEETTFTITVVNQGPDDATGVAVTDTLPDGLTYVADNAAGAYDPTTGVWTIGDLAVAASVAMEFTVTVDDIGIFTNVAEVTAANEEDSDSTPGDGEGDDWDDAVVTSVDIVEASSTIGDYVWYDDDNDQVQDSNEDPVPGVTVQLTNQATNEVMTQVTNADGRYLFAGLDAGTYVVEVLTSTFPANHDLTTVGTYTVTVLDDESFLDADFGIIEILPVTGMEIETAALIGMLFLATGGALLGYENGRRRLAGHLSTAG